MSEKSLTLGRCIYTLRTREGAPLVDFAKRLAVSKSSLIDIEKGRSAISPERAARWAEILEYPVSEFITLALQAQCDIAGLKYTVQITKREITVVKGEQ